MGPFNSIKLYTHPRTPFLGLAKPLEEARYVVVGVPYDGTSTYRPGSRFAPSSIREASLNIETYSFRSAVDVEDAPLADLGDLDVLNDVNETLRRVELVAREILQAGKIPIILGGEHTITLGASRALGDKVGFLIFDAHADLRDEYAGLRIMHATWVRRMAELLGPERIVEVGLRALSKEELKYLKEAGIQFLTTLELTKMNPAGAASIVQGMVRGFDGLYISVDMDVFDPAYAPGVSNPEPDGLSPQLMLEIISRACGDKVAGLDMVELSPHYDSGITAALAAKVILEAIAAMEKRSL